MNIINKIYKAKGTLLEMLELETTTQTNFQISQLMR